MEEVHEEVPETRGVSQELLASVDLGAEIPGMEGYRLRMRRFVFEPGAVFGPLHDHVGRPGTFRAHRWATPMGPEDLLWWPETGALWSVTEHPRRRWVFAMDRKGLHPRTTGR